MCRENTAQHTDKPFHAFTATSVCMGIIAYAKFKDAVIVPFPFGSFMRSDKALEIFKV